MCLSPQLLLPGSNGEAKGERFKARQLFGSGLTLGPVFTPVFVPVPSPAPVPSPEPEPVPLPEPEPLPDPEPPLPQFQTQGGGGGGGIGGHFGRLQGGSLTPSLTVPPAVTIASWMTRHAGVIAQTNFMMLVVTKAAMGLGHCTSCTFVDIDPAPLSGRVSARIDVARR